MLKKMLYTALYEQVQTSPSHTSALWLFKILHDGRERRCEAVEFLAALVKFLVGQKRSGEHLDKMDCYCFPIFYRWYNKR